MTDKEIYKQCLLDGIDLLYKRIMLCNLRRRDNNKYRYQVHSEMSNIQYSELFFDLDKAISKFIELKEATRRNKHV